MNHSAGEPGTSPWRRRTQRLLRSLRVRGAWRTTSRLLEMAEDRLDRMRSLETRYERWLRARGLRACEGAPARSALDAWPRRPLISIVMPVCDPDPRWLARALASVQEQIYPDWQLCMTDDASENPAVAVLLEKAASEDPRIVHIRLPTRSGIASASNAALARARGEFVALLDHDDELTQDALLEVARALLDDGCDLLFSDEDKIDTANRLSDPTFKPGPSPDLLLTCNYFGHLCVYRRTLLEELGGFRTEFDGSQDHDLALRATAARARVRHLPRVLYHWRKAAGSVANPDEHAKPWAYEAGRRAIRDRLARAGEPADVEPGFSPGHSRVRRPVPAGVRVSVIAASVQDLALAAQSAASEIVRIETRPGASVGERWNHAAARATGDVLIFVVGARPVSAAWASEITAQALREDVAVVGVRLRSPRRRLLHMGVVLGGPDRVRVRPLPMVSGEPGPLGLALSLREVSAVTGGCLAIRRELFESLAGFDPGYVQSLHDIDLCLRARSSGQRVLYDGHVEFQSESNALPAFGSTDLARFEQRWHEQLDTDPYYNPAWSCEGDLFAPLYRRRRRR